ncbi:MAG: RagB/SusD family nutrient uptake outer membrane protein [Rikenellaceae bacterium]|jgi:hypothetical protein|nr:RagB/SusD family nutrient uptake outer membrane protein [Rikenellaceae bacterium]
MKRKIIILSVVACLGGCLQSCRDYLSVERYFNDRQDLEQIFNSRKYTEQWLADAYSQQVMYNLEIGHVYYTLPNFSDDMVFSNYIAGISFSDYKFGKYGPQNSQFVDLLAKPWAQSYAGIRQASIFLQYVHPGPEIDQTMCDEFKGKAYFIRGYLYWLLLKKYGPIPILPDNGLDYEDNYAALSLPRNSYDECVDYISRQMVLAAELLPLHPKGSRDAATPTKGAALAVRAKAYLYAASPLINGNGAGLNFVDNTGRQLLNDVVDPDKWAIAAAAAKDVIDLGAYEVHTRKRRVGVGTEAYPMTTEPPTHPVYSTATFPDGWADIDPFESYRSMFNGDATIVDNKELIYTRGNNQINREYGIQSMAAHQLPLGDGGGYNCFGLTAKQCNAYAMDDGTPFVPGNVSGFTTAKGQYPHLGADVWLEYANREPRFYASVAFSGAIWHCLSNSTAAQNNFQAFYYYGSDNGRKADNSGGTDRWIPTGIGIMKFVNPRDVGPNGKTESITAKIDPAIRYADILLMYAEALNEVTSPLQVPTWNGEGAPHNISRNPDEMKRAILPVRLRAGLPNYDELGAGDPYLSVSELRNCIKRERQIEFLGENQRYYDLRRWLDARIDEGQMIKGCNSTVTAADRAEFYREVEIPTAQVAWSEKKYFWPISYDELKRNSKLTQAPGWQSYD